MGNVIIDIDRNRIIALASTALKRFEGKQPLYTAVINYCRAEEIDIHRTLIGLALGMRYDTKQGRFLESIRESGGRSPHTPRDIQYADMFCGNTLQNLVSASLIGTDNLDKLPDDVRHNLTGAVDFVISALENAIGSEANAIPADHTINIINETANSMRTRGLALKDSIPPEFRVRYEDDNGRTP
ncbi:MAG: hypothetical protein H6922_00330 [Pseudomonadaceae bacterium]|nr:hypothetical protein [Pseudomonadaceae bacterium]